MYTTQWTFEAKTRNPNASDMAKLGVGTVVAGVIRGLLGDDTDVRARVDQLDEDGNIVQILEEVAPTDPDKPSTQTIGLPHIKSENRVQF